MKRWFIGLAIGLVAATVAAQESPYREFTGREIKALSEETIRAYREGQGMGYAMPAELNSYPGPKHVLELAEPLHLAPEQRAAIQASFDRMHEQAVRLGREIVAREAELDALFASGDADEDRLRVTVMALAGLEGELRVTHLRAHLETRALLDEGQVRAYDALRGYGAGGPPAHDPAHHHGAHPSGGAGD